MIVYTITMLTDGEVSTVAFLDIADVLNELNGVVEWEGSISSEEWASMLAEIAAFEDAEQDCEAKLRVQGTTEFTVARHKL